jgi:hypothetical protein
MACMSLLVEPHEQFCLSTPHPTPPHPTLSTFSLNADIICLNEKVPQRRLKGKGNFDVNSCDQSDPSDDFYCI